ncbi:MAG TPA: DUF1592 domain-containing protein [Nannocystaceae bacterium]|nr:DUF1592 domain-containing protein [Nannocystaceae bacterium]
MRRLATPALVFVAACYEGLAPTEIGVDATSGDPGTSGVHGDGTSEGSTGDALGCTPDAGPMVVRRLTRFEYDNTVRDLLGTSLRPAQDFAPDPVWLGFDNNGSVATVGDAIAEQYLHAAEALAADAIGRLPELLPCDPALADDACIDAFVAAFVRKAWRREPTAQQLAALRAVYDAGGGLEHGIGMLIETVLQSPRFLYRFELGRDELGDGLARLDGHEIASRLSYFVWGSLPDDALLDAAAAGELEARDAVMAHAERMLDDPRAEDGVVHLFEQVLGLQALDGIAKDPAVFPAWSDAVRDSMHGETRRFVAEAVLHDDGTLDGLVNARFTFADATLAEYYGLAQALGPELERVELDDDDHRGGLLRLGALSAALGKFGATAPVLRGKFVRQQLLCESLPPPPDDVDFEPPDIDPDATARERYEQHSIDAQCSGCHVRMDPIGFGFEHYDGAGAWRELEHGLPIDDRGTIVGLDARGDVHFTGVDGLADELLASGRLHDCVALHSFRYALGRAETLQDECTLDELRASFRAHGDIRRLVVEIVGSEAFRTVRPAEAP